MEFVIGCDFGYCSWNYWPLSFKKQLFLVHSRSYQNSEVQLMPGLHIKFSENTATLVCSCNIETAFMPLPKSGLGSHKPFAI